ncbi:hypothetical protein V1290_001029 [Bradyrhizobium sp. AZCC 1578]
MKTPPIVSPEACKTARLEMLVKEEAVSGDRPRNAAKFLTLCT